MKKIYKIIKLILNPLYRFNVLTYYGFFNYLTDKNFLKTKFKLVFGKELNLDKPQTFNEKLQWLKLYDRNPLYTTMVDKYKVKEYVANIIGKEYIIPTLGVYNNTEEVDFDKLPNQFVLKCTHDSGGLVICKDKSKFNYKAAYKKINKSLKRIYFWQCREWPYKNVSRKIIAEQYMEDNKTKELRDYKFFCFNGTPKMLFVASDRQKPNEETKFDFYDMRFNHLPFTNGHPNSSEVIEKPKNFELMKDLARKLSQNIPHVRVDFYEINEKVYFGELTFSHWSGFVPFEPSEWDKKIGDWLILPNKKNENKNFNRSRYCSY